MTTIAKGTSLDHDSIATRAYYLWEADGRPDGCHEAHWLAAEAAEKRSVSARRAAATRRVKQETAPKASAKTVVAAAALSGARAASAGARAPRRVH